MRLATLGACVLALLTAVPAFAQDDDVDTVDRPASEARVPNFFGTTGLLTTPSAYTQGRSVATPYFGGTSDFFGGGVALGLGDRFELGFSVIDADEQFGGGGAEFLLNAKLNVVREDDNTPAIAIGVVDALDELNADPGWYVVASKYFTRGDTDRPFALKGHLGYGDGIYDNELFGGVELFFNREVSALAEIANGDFNVGARYHRNGFAATLAFFDLDRLGGSISYSIAFR